MAGNETQIDAPKMLDSLNLESIDAAIEAEQKKLAECENRIGSLKILRRAAYVLRHGKPPRKPRKPRQPREPAGGEPDASQPPDSAENIRRQGENPKRVELFDFLREHGPQQPGRMARELCLSVAQVLKLADHEWFERAAGGALEISRKIKS